ncbi:alkaline phosphatase family protein [Kitasatospora sp. NPDC058965]|uniref:alkaline phosphatase family protein n=1 Tax=Kitasatospora sp. NPDC058965 TaxID=3346682 RepID=UPI00367C6A53
MPAAKAYPRRALTALSVAALAAGSLGIWSGTGTAAHAAALPTPDHVVVVVLENHAYDQVIGNAAAPYLNSLAAGGATLTQSYGITHPSQPNYYALFSGDTQGIVDDSCVTPGFSSAANLGSELIAAGQTFGSYNEDLPAPGDAGCRSGDYAQKHNPWFGFGNVPTDSAATFDQFPTDFGTLPKVSFVVPNLCNDMHDCSVDTGDSWVSANLSGYAAWALNNNSLLLVTFDEDDKASGNHIPTLVYGQHVAAGSTTGTAYNHYDVLRTLEDLAGLTAHAGNAATASDVTGIWN